jgi:NADH:ubiquinone oxidoreductase subunit 4 (subunit M)
MFQRSMQNRGTAGDEETALRSRELDSGELALLLPAVLVILALAVYPQYVVERIEPNASQAVTSVTKPASSPVAERSETEPVQ